jgi:hypothetical protein
VQLRRNGGLGKRGAHGFERLPLFGGQTRWRCWSGSRPPRPGGLPSGRCGPRPRPSCGTAGRPRGMVGAHFTNALSNASVKRCILTEGSGHESE